MCSEAAGTEFEVLYRWLSAGTVTVAKTFGLQQGFLTSLDHGPF